MKILFILAAVVLAIVIFRVLRSNSKSTAKAPSAAKRVKSARNVIPSSDAYHAVSVTCGPNACQQALELGEKRFLPAEMPRFPLPDCTSSKCQCKFAHYDDRRDPDSEKRAPTALRSQLYTNAGRPERRSRGGRRKTDQD